MKDHQNQQPAILHARAHTKAHIVYVCVTEEKKGTGTILRERNICFYVDPISATRAAVKGAWQKKGNLDRSSFLSF